MDQLNHSEDADQASYNITDSPEAHEVQFKKKKGKHNQILCCVMECLVFTRSVFFLMM